jgi:type IV secretion system protein VirB9
MTRGIRFWVAALPACSLLGGAMVPAGAQPADPRLREATYDSHAVVTIPVKRGVVTLVELADDEAIAEVAAGLGGDCAKPEAAWCVAAKPGGRHLFVKPKGAASAANNLTVVTNRRTHTLRFAVLADGDPKQPVYRLTISAPPPPPSTIVRPLPATTAPDIRPTTPPAPLAEELVAERLQAKPQIVNSSYSIAEGKNSDDIVPSLVFDDGRFTYFRLSGNREVPAVFHVLGDGSETLVNARMEDDLLVVDRVSRQLMLRAGSAVVGVWNDAFDLEGVPPAEGTTAAGVRRALKTGASAARRFESGERHE